MIWPQAKGGWQPPEARRSLEQIPPQSFQKKLTLQTSSSKTPASGTVGEHISVCGTCHGSHRTHACLWPPLPLGVGTQPLSVQTLHLHQYLAVCSSAHGAVGGWAQSARCWGRHHTSGAQVHSLPPSQRQLCVGFGASSLLQRHRAPFLSPPGDPGSSPKTFRKNPLSVQCGHNQCLWL